MGQTETSRAVRHVRSSPAGSFRTCKLHVANRIGGIGAARMVPALLDRVVGAREKRCWNLEAYDASSVRSARTAALIIAMFSTAASLS